MRILIPLIVLIVWLVPIIAGIWAITTLNKLKAGQDVILARLNAIEQSLRRP